jgi:hypothetical protein
MRASGLAGALAPLEQHIVALELGNGVDLSLGMLGNHDQLADVQGLVVKCFFHFAFLSLLTAGCSNYSLTAS